MKFIFTGDEKLSSEDGIWGGSESNHDVQNVTRSLEWTDHGKEVKCIATHIALDRALESRVTLDVNCMYNQKIIFISSFKQSGY